MRVQELIREGARKALNPSRAWVQEIDAAILNSLPTIAADPELAAVVLRTNRSNITYFTAAMVRTPGAPVPARLSAGNVRLAQELARRGLDTSALEMYRVAQNVAWQRWTQIAFGLTSDPQELRELFDAPFRSLTKFVDDTIAGIAANMRTESDYGPLFEQKRLERLELVDLLLTAGEVDPEVAGMQLGYRLDRPHTAAVVWSDDLAIDPSSLGQAAKVFVKAASSGQSLSLVSSESTLWLWVEGPAAVNATEIAESIDPQVRIAIGSTAPGIEGFVRSHQHALTAQSVLFRLGSSRQIAQFGQLQLVALITENISAADDFIATTLGDFAFAAPAMHTALLTYIRTECNASRAAKRLFTHRNTLLHRLEAAQRLLPAPLEESLIEVAAALEIMQWRTGPLEVRNPGLTSRSP